MSFLSFVIGGLPERAIIGDLAIIIFSELFFIIIRQKISQ